MVRTRQTRPTRPRAFAQPLPRSRGSTIPEIDTPGHSRAIGMSPELRSIVSCADTDGASYTTNCKEPPCGQLNPSSTLMYEVLGDVLHDVCNLFSSNATGMSEGKPSFVHLGFDEVDAHCWTSDPSVAAYMKANNLNVSTLLEEFFSRERDLLGEQTQGAGGRAIYWDEVVSQNLHKKLRPSDAVQFWHAGNSGLLEKYLRETPGSNTAILSAYTSYYLDCGTGNEFGGQSWCDPLKSGERSISTTRSVASTRLFGKAASSVARRLSGRRWPRLGLWTPNCGQGPPRTGLACGTTGRGASQSGD